MAAHCAHALMFGRTPPLSFVCGVAPYARECARDWLQRSLDAHALPWRASERESTLAQYLVPSLYLMQLQPLVQELHASLRPAPLA